MVLTPAHQPLFDTNPHTGATIEVFYADRALETFGWQGAGWFWCARRRGYSATGPATGPFPTSYAAYLDATRAPAGVTYSVNADTLRTGELSDLGRFQLSN
jgi:hypothetical protein